MRGSRRSGQWKKLLITYAPLLTESPVDAGLRNRANILLGRQKLAKARSLLLGKMRVHFTEAEIVELGMFCVVLLRRGLALASWDMSKELTAPALGLVQL